MSTTAFIGLGSNWGDRARHFVQALLLLESQGAVVHRLSSIYESSPVGPVEDQPLFLNAVAEVTTSLEPQDLLGGCFEIEKQLGRQRTIRQGPRTIDLDLLLFGDRVLERSHLTVPHPRLSERAFVLLPLLELDPELKDPRNGTPLLAYLERLGGGQAIRRCGELDALLREGAEPLALQPGQSSRTKEADLAQTS